jgi:hypothetical protein
MHLCQKPFPVVHFFPKMITFATTIIKHSKMATLVLDVDNRSNVKKLIEALRLFKGVKKVSLEDDLSFPQLDKSIEEANSGQTVHCKDLSELIHSLHS